MREELQRTSYDDSLFQEWAEKEASKAVSANEVIATGMRTAGDGVLLANYCAALTASVMVNKYDTAYTLSNELC